MFWVDYKIVVGWTYVHDFGCVCVQSFRIVDL